MKRKFLSMALCTALTAGCLASAFVIADANTVPKYATLLLDTSSSMSTEFKDTTKAKNTDTKDTNTDSKFTRLDSEKLAAKAFCEEFLKEKNNKVSIISYDNDAKVVCEFTNDISSINKKIDELKAKGSSNLNDGLTKAKTEFDKELKNSNIRAEKNIIITTDGAPSSGTKLDKYAYTEKDTEYYKFANAVNKYVKDYFKDTKIYTIGLNDIFTELNEDIKDSDFDKDKVNTEDVEDTLLKSYKFVKKFLADISTSKDTTKLVSDNKEFITTAKAIAKSINISVKPKKESPDTASKPSDSDVTSSNTSSSDIESKVESKPIESNVESKVESTPVESSVESKVESKVESNVESKIESKPVESNVESRPTESNVESKTESNTSSNSISSSKIVGKEESAVNSNSSGGSVKARTDGSSGASVNSSTTSGSSNSTDSNGKSVTTGDVTKGIIVILSTILVIAGALIISTYNKKNSDE